MRATVPILGIPILLYIGAVALSILAAESSALAFFEVTLLVQSYFLFFYLANKTRSADDVVFVLTFIGASFAVQGLLVIATWALGHGFQLGMVKGTFSDGRAGGTVGSPVTAGSLMALLCMPVGSLLLLPLHRLHKAFIFAALVVGGLAIMLTQTRGAIITVGVSALLTGTLLGWRGWLPRWVIGTTLLLLMVVAFPLAQVVSNRVLSDDHGSAIARVHLARIAAQMIEDHPLLGVGAGNCHRAALSYSNQSEFRAEWFYTVHSKYLLVWVETGILGFMAFAALILSILRSGWMGWRQADPRLAIPALAIASAVVGQMIHMAVDVFNSRPQVQMLWCCAGLLAALSHGFHGNELRARLIRRVAYA